MNRCGEGLSRLEVVDFRRGCFGDGDEARREHMVEERRCKVWDAHLAA